MDRPIFIDNVLGLETATLRADRAASCARPIAARSASSSCISRIRPRRPGSRSASKSIRNQTEFTAKGKRAILERLTAAEVFERFLDRKYTGTKRFGLDGGETADPGAGADPEARQPARRQGGRDRHGPSRPAERARQFHGQALRRDLLGIPGQSRQSRGRPGLGRRQIPSRHLGRPRVRRQDRPSLADRQPLASRGGQYGGAGQGARQAAPEAAIPSAARSWRC